MPTRIPGIRSKGCVQLFIEFTSLIANIATIFEYLERLLHPIPNVRHNFLFPDLDFGPLASGIILIYGLAGISLFIWSFLSGRVIGDLQAVFYAFTLYIFSASLLIYAYVNTYFSANFINFLFSKTSIFLFILLPFAVGRIGLEIFLAPRRPRD